MRSLIPLLPKTGMRIARPCFAAIMVLLTILAASQTTAQSWPHWQNAGTFPVHEAAPYFINENYGFVFTSGKDGPTLGITTDACLLWRTNDGGITWSTINLGGLSLSLWKNLAALFYFSLAWFYGSS